MLLRARLYIRFHCQKEESASSRSRTVHSEAPRRSMAAAETASRVTRIRKRSSDWRESWAKKSELEKLASASALPSLNGATLLNMPVMALSTLDSLGIPFFLAFLSGLANLAMVAASYGVRRSSARKWRSSSEDSEGDRSSWRTRKREYLRGGISRAIMTH